jgi:hypothetical protein
LDNGTPTPSKRQRTAEVIILSDDSSDLELLDDVQKTHHRDPGPDRVPAGTGPKHCPATLSVIEQLRHDEFYDFKAELCLELDNLRPSAKTESNAADCKDAATGSKGEPEYNVQGVRDALQPWLEQDKATRHTNHLYYRLDHIYSEDGFIYQPRDQEVIETLAHLMDDVPVEIFHAMLEREDSDLTPSYLASTLVDLDGRIPVIWDIPVDEQSWVQTRLPSLKACPPMVEAVSI